MDAVIANESDVRYRLSKEMLFEQELELQEEGVGLLSLTQASDARVRESDTTRSWSASRWALLLLQYLKRACLFLLPSFISERIPSKAPSEPSPVRPTAFLDGLRGVAAWTVFNTHLSSVISRTNGNTFNLRTGQTEVWKLPFIQLVYKGDFAVALFFVISGFALSISPVRAMNKSPREAGAMEKLSSAIFRRPIRLFLPSWAATLIVFVLIRINFFGALVAQQSKFETLLNGWPILTVWPTRDTPFFTQLLDLIQVDLNMLQIFLNPNGSMPVVIYNPVLWTVVLEFRASLVLFLTHAAVYKMRRKSRISIIMGLICLGVLIGSVDFTLFWSGYLIAELSNKIGEEESSGKVMSAVWAIVLLAGLFLGSYTGWHPEEQADFAWLFHLTPASFVESFRFWTGVGAFLTVLSLRKLPILLKFYTSPPVLYVGKISFSLYLVHFWIAQGLGTVVFYHVWRVTSKDNVFTTFIGFVISYCTVLGLTIWAADIFWRCVDAPSVSLSIALQRGLAKEA